MESEKSNLINASIDGLSVGDSFGEKFFGNPDVVQANIENRILPEPPWRCTDDTIMGISVAKTLRDCKKVDQDYLIREFSRLYRMDPARGYGRRIFLLETTRNLQYTNPKSCQDSFRH